jgi:hypothetical protein
VQQLFNLKNSATPLILIESFMKILKITLSLFLLLMTCFFLKLEAQQAVKDIQGGSMDVELIYDNNTPNLQINFKNTTANHIATRFTPPHFPASILKAKFYVADTSEGAFFQFSVLDNSGDRPSADIYGPEIIHINQIGWNEIDLSDQNLVLEDDFYFALWLHESFQPKFGAENRPPLSMRTYDADA